MPESLILILLSHPDPRLLPHECLPVLACACLVQFQFHTRLCLLNPQDLSSSVPTPAILLRQDPPRSSLLRFAMSNASSQSLVFLIDRLNATKLVSTGPLASPRALLHAPLAASPD